MLKHIPKSFVTRLRYESSDFDHFCKQHGNVTSNVLKEIISGTYLEEDEELSKTTIKTSTYLDCEIYDKLSVEDYLTKLKNMIQEALSLIGISEEDVVSIHSKYGNLEFVVCYERPETAAEKSERLRKVKIRAKLYAFSSLIRNYYNEWYSEQIEQERLAKIAKNQKQLEGLEKRQAELQKQIDILKSGE
ncbi:hypothetical protein XaC1_239 [Xanthomonas phage XaC1]|nr:hypothetical protein XaC1_239 [Xanthomonas phage XaC1]